MPDASLSKIFLLKISYRLRSFGALSVVAGGGGGSTISSQKSQFSNIQLSLAAS